MRLIVVVLALVFLSPGEDTAGRREETTWHQEAELLQARDAVQTMTLPPPGQDP